MNDDTLLDLVNEESNAWKIVIEAVKEAEGRYSMKLLGSVKQELDGCYIHLLAPDVGQEMRQFVEWQALIDDALLDLVRAKIDSVLRGWVELRDKEKVTIYKNEWGPIGASRE